MPLTKKMVMDQIRAAFKGVALGNGVGLHQGQAIDAYMDEEAQQEYRIQDEKKNWEEIPVEKLDLDYSSLSFFDAEGMRFHLPAYLIADLLGSLKMADPSFHVMGLEVGDPLSDYKRNKFTLLSPEQRAAVRSYFLLIRDLPEFSRSEVDSALQGYWAEKK